MVSKSVLCILAAIALMSAPSGAQLISSGNDLDFGLCVNALNIIDVNLGLGLDIGGLLGGVLDLVGNLLGGLFGYRKRIPPPSSLDAGLAVIIKGLLVVDIGLNDRFGSAYNKRYLSQLCAYYVRQSCRNVNEIDLSQSWYQLDSDFNYVNYCQGLAAFQASGYASYYKPLLDIKVQLLNLLNLGINIGNLGRLLSINLNIILGSSKIWGYYQADQACAVARRAYAPLLLRINVSLDVNLINTSNYQPCRPCLAY